MAMHLRVEFHGATSSTRAVVTPLSEVSTAIISPDAVLSMNLQVKPVTVPVSRLPRSRTTTLHPLQRPSATEGRRKNAAVGFDSVSRHGQPPKIVVKNRKNVYLTPRNLAQDRGARTAF